MSEANLWVTINKALNPEQRKELNTIISAIKCYAGALFVHTEGRESLERSVGIGLKLLTDQIPDLEGPGVDSPGPQAGHNPDSEPTEAEKETFRREALCELRETNASYKECAIQLGITAERAELDHTDMITARIESLSKSHPYGLAKPPLQDLVRCAARRRSDGKLLGSAQWRVMWPYTEWPYPFDPEDEASELIADLLSALTIQLPFHARESIQKRRLERLFSALQRFPQHDNQDNPSLTPDQRELAIRKSGGLRGRRPGCLGSGHGTSQDCRQSSEGPSNKN